MTWAGLRRARKPNWLPLAGPKRASEPTQSESSSLVVFSIDGQLFLDVVVVVLSKGDGHAGT